MGVVGNWPLLSGRKKHRIKRYLESAEYSNFNFFPHAGLCVLEREIHFSVCMNGGIALVPFWVVAGIGERGKEEVMGVRCKQIKKRGLKSHENVKY